MNKIIAKLKAHKWAVAIVIGVAAAADHFLGNAIVSGILVDLLASVPAEIAQ